MAQIEIKDLTFYYDDFYHRVFEHLNVNLDTDWKMALVGRNGRGKTHKLVSGINSNLSSSIVFLQLSQIP